MPELAEVEYYRKQWEPAHGQTVTGVHLNAEKRVFRGIDTRALRKDIVGQKLEDSEAHGKQMCFRFGQSHWLGVHLGMTGKTRILQSGELPEKHDHLVLQMGDARSLVFSDPRMFGRILYSNTIGEPAWWAMRSPAILSDDFTFERMNQFLERRAKSPIKAVLLMQETFPGVGNWMADEICWSIQVRPHRHAGSLTDGERENLYKALQFISQEALRIIGTDWGDLPDSWLFNHRWKDGGICPKTGCKLIREKIGGRTTCWSPDWQR